MMPAHSQMMYAHHGMMGAHIQPMQYGMDDMSDLFSGEGRCGEKQRHTQA